MALFSKTAEVQDFNQRVVDSLDTLSISIASIDKELKAVRQRKRVMLRRTVDRVKGLVNGLTGVLEEVQRVGEQISTIGVRFDRIPEKIVRIACVPGACELSSGVKITRSQFPLEPASAVTIHKSQGLTLNNVLLATSSIFTTAQFFVGCSRVRPMDGLHLIVLDSTKATADPKAIKEYDRLRKLAVINDAPVV